MPILLEIEVDENTVTFYLCNGDWKTWPEEAQNIYLEHAICDKCGELVKRFGACACEDDEPCIGNERYFIGKFHMSNEIFTKKFAPIIREAIKKEKVKRSSDKRKQRMKNAEGLYTEGDIQKLKDIQGKTCYFCGAEMHKEEVEHLIPLSKGGTNWPLNLVLACPTCNRSKQAKTDVEFWQQLEEKNG